VGTRVDPTRPKADRTRATVGVKRIPMRPSRAQMGPREPPEQQKVVKVDPTRTKVDPTHPKVDWTRAPMGVKRTYRSAKRAQVGTTRAKKQPKRARVIPTRAKVDPTRTKVGPTRPKVDRMTIKCPDIQAMSLFQHYTWFYLHITFAIQWICIFCMQLRLLSVSFPHSDEGLWT
jgi:hypothetical protein